MKSAKSVRGCLAFGVLIVIGVAGCGASKERAATQETMSRNNLKQIGIATMLQDSVAKRQPMTTDGDGKALLSWRVHLLPFLDQKELFAQFKLDEPWDSEHNKKLLEKMPEIYKAPGSSAAKEFKTNYLRPRSSESGFPDEEHLVKFQRIRDGLGNTIMVMEVSDERAVPWTKPADYEIDQERPSAGVVGLRDGRFLVLLFDGAVRHLKSDVDPKSLNALYTCKGKEDVDLDSLE